MDGQADNIGRTDLWTDMIGRKERTFVGAVLRFTLERLACARDVVLYKKKADIIHGIRVDEYI